MKKLIIILAVIGLTSALFATEMIVHTTSGNQEFEISEITSITFSNPSNIQSNFLVKTNDGVVFVDSTGFVSDFVTQSGDVEILNDRIFIINFEQSIIEEYDIDGSLINTISTPNGYRWFTVLPNYDFALFSNSEDNIVFIDYQGNTLATVNMINPSPGQLQNLDGIVVNNSLILSENGNNQILKVDLATYEISIFNDLSNLTGWLGAITYDSGIYYICQATTIYSFIEGQNENLVSTLPEGNITGIVINDNFAFVTINFSGRIYKVNLTTGASEIFSENLNYPKDIEKF